MALRTVLSRRRVTGRVAVDEEKTEEKRSRRYAVSVDSTALQTATGNVAIGLEVSLDGGKTWKRFCRFGGKLEARELPSCTYANKRGWLIRPFVESDSATPVGMEIDD